MFSTHEIPPFDVDDLVMIEEDTLGKRYWRTGATVTRVTPSFTPNSWFVEVQAYDGKKLVYRDNEVSRIGERLKENGAENV